MRILNDGDANPGAKYFNTIIYTETLIRKK